MNEFFMVAEIISKQNITVFNFFLKLNYRELLDIAAYHIFCKFELKSLILISIYLFSFNSFVRK